MNRLHTYETIGGNRRNGMDGPQDRYTGKRAISTPMERSNGPFVDIVWPLFTEKIGMSQKGKAVMLDNAGVDYELEVKRSRKRVIAETLKIEPESTKSSDAASDRTVTDQQFKRNAAKKSSSQKRPKVIRSDSPIDYVSVLDPLNEPPFKPLSKAKQPPKWMSWRVRKEEEEQAQNVKSSEDPISPRGLRLTVRVRHRQ